MNPVELRRKQAQRLDNARGLMDAIEQRDGAMTDEERSQFDALMAEADQLEADAVRAERLEGFRGVTMPPGDNERRAPAFHPTRTADTEESIVCRYLRSGDMAAAAELRAYNDTDMNVTTAADGEVIVPVGMVNSIAARRDEMALFTRLGVRRVPGKGTTVNWPIDNEADVVFASVAESGDVLQDAPALTEKAFTLVKYGKHITLTWELLRDEDAALLSFLNDWIARGWAATHNSLLITEAAANGTAGLTLDSATAIGQTEIPELVGKLMPEYQDGAQWIMHPTTYASISGVTGNAFAFAPMPYGAPQGPTLWGYPVNQSSYATALAASAKSLLFGNFNFMGMREGTGLTMLRDPYSVASKGQVRLWFWFDAVYGVLQAEAIQYATHPTA